MPRFISYFFNNFFRLKGSFFSVLILIQVLLISLSLLFTKIIIESSKTAEIEKNTAIAKYIEDQVNKETDRPVLLSMAVADNSYIMEAFSQNNREILLSRAKEFWEKLKTQGLTQYQFNVPSPAGMVTFLRVHQPAVYGEVNSSYRPTVVKCNFTKELVKGLEQGKSGYGFRAVVPAYYKSKYIGCMEFGTDLGQEFLHKLSKDYVGKWSILNLDRGVNTLGGDKVVISFLNQTLEQVSAQNLALPATILSELKKGKPAFVSDAQTESVSIYVPIKNFRDDVALYIKHEYSTTYYQRIRQILWTAFGICLIGLLISGAIIWTLYRQIKIPIAGLMVETEKIKNFQLDEKVTVKAKFEELKKLVDAISSMKIGLSSFKKYVPDQLVRQLIQTNQEANISGQRREMTIFFSDIANFTSISETLKPRELAAQLSSYFEEVTKIIMEEQGTVDKYIGDCVMAFWGAPLEVKNHAFLACKAALRAQKRIHELEKQNQANDVAHFHTRIGINTGDVIVGNMGSEQRMNYTVIGDTVNLASRIEGLNKKYKTSIIISETTYQHCKDEIEARILDFVAVRGKTEIVTIYELVAERGDISTIDKELLSQFNEAILLYQNRQWDAALKLLTSLLKRAPDDHLASLFIARCEHFKLHAPSEDWQGNVDIKMGEGV